NIIITASITTTKLREFTSHLPLSPPGACCTRISFCGGVFLGGGFIGVKRYFMIGTYTHINALLLYFMDLQSRTLSVVLYCCYLCCVFIGVILYFMFATYTHIHALLLYIVDLQGRPLSLV